MKRRWGMIAGMVLAAPGCARLNMDKRSAEEVAPARPVVRPAAIPAETLYHDGECLVPRFAEIPPAARVSEAAKNPVGFATEMRNAITARVDHYTLVLSRERFKNDALQPPEEIFSACRARPLALYLRWDAGDFKGRQALFVNGQNHDRIIVKLTGLMAAFVKTVELAPNDPVVTDHGRLPPADQQRLVVPFDDIIKSAHDHPMVKGMPALTIEPSAGDISVPVVTLRYHEPRGKLMRSVVVVTLDPQTLLPATITTLDNRGRTVEVLRFNQWRVNDPLPEETFDRNNPAYQF